MPFFILVTKELKRHFLYFFSSLNPLKSIYSQFICSSSDNNSELQDDSVEKEMFFYYLVSKVAVSNV